MTPLRTAVKAATDRLSAAGVDSPEHDARALAVHVLGLAKPSDLLLVDELDVLVTDAAPPAALSEALAAADITANRSGRYPAMAVNTRWSRSSSRTR